MEDPQSDASDATGITQAAGAIGMLLIFGGLLLQNVYGAPADGTWGRLDLIGVVSGVAVTLIGITIDLLRSPRS